MLLLSWSFQTSSHPPWNKKPIVTIPSLDSLCIKANGEISTGRFNYQLWWESRLAPGQVLPKISYRMTSPRSFEILIVTEWEIELGSCDAQSNSTHINGPPSQHVKKIALKIEVKMSSLGNSRGSLLTLHVMGDALLLVCEDLHFCAINTNKRYCLCINAWILK